ncbi:MAG: hypothetical protein ACRYFV_01605 [Janthinobacterium lividum]
MGLAYTQALLERATAYLARPLTAAPEGKRSAEGLLELATIWAAIHRCPLPECLRQCAYSERHASVAAYVRDFSSHSSFTAMSETTQTKYQIAPAFAGQQFVHDDLAAPVTAENLTDETAEFFIKHGRKDAFILRAGAETKPEAGEVIAVEPESPLVPQADLEAEQSAHATTQASLKEYQDNYGQAIGSLKAEQEAHGKTTAKLEKETEAHTKANEALKSEKEAHKATKKDLSEVQKQLAEAQKQVADLTAAAAAKPEVPAPTEPAA